MMGRNGIVVVFAAFAAGVAAGWFAAGKRCGDAAPASRDDGGVVATSHDGGVVATSHDGRAVSMKTPEAPKVYEAELAALRDKAASLEGELNGLLDARERKSKADAQENGGDDSQKDGSKVSVDEALMNCSTFGELKQRYPDAWREWHGKQAEHATRVLERYDSWRGFMSELDVSSMTDDERENHERLMEIYGKKHALMRETHLCDDDEMTFEKYKENDIEMYRLDREGAKLMAAERNTLLRITSENLGRRLGWTEADTVEFAETLRAVGDATSGDMTN